MKTAAAVTTVRDALTDAMERLERAGVEEARLDARLMLAFAMGQTREALARDPNAIVDERAKLIFDKAVQLRCDRRPLPYITGEQWFYGRPFKVNRAVLIPRPETEMLVEFALKHSPARWGKFADLGAGSGCIAVTIAAERPDSHVWATDISPLALNVTQKNIARYKVGNRLYCVEGDLFDPLAGLTFDVVVSNPPYIRADERDGLMREVRDYEPALALWGGESVDTGDDGTLVHRRIMDAAGAFLVPHGWVAVEVGLGQADIVADAARSAGLEAVEVLKDSAGIGRIVAARNPGS